MSAWKRNRTICVFLMAAFVIFLPIAANAYQVNLTSYQSGYDSSGEILGYLNGHPAESTVFGCMQFITQVTVPGGPYYAQDLALTGEAQLKTAWLMDTYGPTLRGAYGSYSVLQTGVAMQNAMWSVLGYVIQITDTNVLNLVNDMVTQVNAVSPAVLSSVGSRYVYVDLYSNANWTGPVQDLIRTTVPVPAAVWLLGSGLLGLVAIRRRMRK